MVFEAFAFWLGLALGIYALLQFGVLFIRTFEPDLAQRWGWGRLAFAWFRWLLVSLLAAALILPGISCARGPARRAQCMNNLKRIMLAMHNYHDVYGCFPPAYTVDKDGQPLHSWRTLLLHVMEARTLPPLRLDEPYDSPHNRTMFDLMERGDGRWPSVASVFRCPSDGSKQTETSYVMILGPHTISNGPNSIRLKDITDGPGNTIAVVETYGLGTAWYEPRDLRADEMTFKINDPEYFGIASQHPGGAQASLADGSVRFLPESLDPRGVEALTTIHGGEDVSAVLKEW